MEETAGPSLFYDTGLECNVSLEKLKRSQGFRAVFLHVRTPFLSVSPLVAGSAGLISARKASIIVHLGRETSLSCGRFDVSRENETAGEMETR